MKIFDPCEIFERIKKQLREDEGLRLYPYDDATGIRIQAAGNITIGYGINLDAGISIDEAELLLNNRVQRSMVELAAIFDIEHMRIFPDSVHIVLISMVYNMGAKRFKTFKKMIAALEIYDYQGAAREMIDSKWFKQLPGRAGRLADIMGGV